MTNCTHNQASGLQWIFVVINGKHKHTSVRYTADGLVGYLSVTFHLRLARKRFILSFLRDLVGLRFRKVKEAIQGWVRASAQDNLHLECRWVEKQKQSNTDNSL